MNENNLRFPASKQKMMPLHTNARGKIFGGVIISQIDLAAVECAEMLSPEQSFVTVCMKEIVFKKPVHVGDTVTCFTSIEKVGRSSLTINVEVEATRNGKQLLVTTAQVIMVAVDENENSVQITGTLEDYLKRTSCPRANT
jgi:acyl-CoA thioesterase YciA